MNVNNKDRMITTISIYLQLLGEILPDLQLLLAFSSQYDGFQIWEIPNATHEQCESKLSVSKCVGIAGKTQRCECSGRIHHL